MQQLARRLRTADQTIESDRAYASGPRLARYLKRLIRKDVETSHRVELSQTELGNFAGMSREHINRQLRSEEHTSELQSLMRNSYAVFCLKKKKSTDVNYEHETAQQPQYGE